MKLGHERTSKLAIIEGKLCKMKDKYGNFCRQITGDSEGAQRS
jgi:hypothetical protein